MDDYLDSFEDPDFAFEMSQDMITLLALGGLKITKFISNVTKIIKELNPPRSAPQQESKINETCGDYYSHILGLKWDHIDDTLVVSRGVNREFKNTITQRTVLRFVSSLFDPIGLVALYTVRARLLLKEIRHIPCQQWDDELPIDIKTKFFAWHSGLPSLGKMNVKRSYISAPVDWVELHMFGDSSEEVFCAEASLRARVKTSLETQVAFVFGKAGVAPMKALSIPKLELQARLLAFRLNEGVLKALTIQHCVKHVHVVKLR